MTSLAGMLKSRGFEVSGSDQNIYPPASTLLERLGIPVRLGYRAENLEPAPDLVVVGNAVSRTNPEVAALLERRLPYLSMPQAIRRFFLAGKRSLVVAGTHGKTTSTAMLAWVLECARREPSLMIGGDSLDFGGNFRLGRGEDFVVEGDEYDTAFFDKGPKFLHYEPRGLILTSVEFDHADIYRDLRQVTDAFVALLRIVPSEAPVVVCADFGHAEAVVREAGRGAERFGLAANADWRAVDLRDEDGWTRFSVRFAGRAEADLRLRLMGEMNARNALGVYALCRRLGLPGEAIRPGLESFRGVRRRQEVIHEGAITVIDDFAHHPTAIAATLAAVRARYGGRKLWAVFEPRSNTSRRRTFQREFAAALCDADAAVVAAVFFKDTDPIPESERLSVAAVVADLRGAGREAETFADGEAIFAHLRRSVRDGDVVVFLSNGAFGGLPRRFAEAL
ncbi:MAG: UDP-N-acetylmuramate:L-alanyl-gamma-D-glutamyl-meso-diaminopimelate ligase [Deltaproteobacteria bacterium]|nr:UDP-N-acetylmuramate:L-alanyl-gamma-D-glutamyl-meso-diaminopimelate ligase [Deltaproteobacteria bacterium]